MRTLLLTALLTAPMLASAANVVIDNANGGRPAISIRSHPGAAFEGSNLIELENGRAGVGHSASAHSATARNDNHAMSLNQVSRTEAAAEPENIALMLAGLGAMGLIMSRRHRD